MSNRKPGAIFNAAKFEATLRARMLERGLSARAVADEAGIHAATVNRLLAGRAPDLETFGTLTRWFGARADEFFAVTAPRGARRSA